MPRPTAYLENWKHGFIRVDAKGRKTYVIREMVNGERLKVSTRAHTLDGALAAYALWSKDPAGFENGPQLAPPLAPQQVLLTRGLVDEFLEWSQETGFHGRGNTVGHVANQRIAMDFWLKHLARRDLHHVDLERDILPVLIGQSQQANRRRTLKAFFSWLRSEDGGNRIKLAEDPVARALKVPKSDPRARTKANKAVAWRDLLKVRDALQGHWRAAFEVQMATGWHGTEIKRFAIGGVVEKYNGPQKGVGAVLVCPEHKNGGEHRSAVDKAAVAAAKQVLAYGSFEPANYSREVLRVSAVVKVKTFTAGQLRHSVATHMINDLGADLATVSTFLGHKSPATTARFYATHTVPKNPTFRAGA
jgi:integrase